MRCYRRLLNISYKEQVTNEEEVRNRIQNAIGVHEDFLTIVKKRKQTVWSNFKILVHGEDVSAGVSEGSKKERKTEEEIGYYHQRMDENGVWRFPEGSGRQGRMERYCCNVTCGALTTSETETEMRDEMRPSFYKTFYLLASAFDSKSHFEQSD